MRSAALVFVLLACSAAKVTPSPAPAVATTAAPATEETPPSELRLRRYSCPELVLGPGPSLSFIEKDGICCGYPEPIVIPAGWNAASQTECYFEKVPGLIPFRRTRTLERFVGTGNGWIDLEFEKNNALAPASWDALGSFVQRQPPTFFIVLEPEAGRPPSWRLREQGAVVRRELRRRGVVAARIETVTLPTKDTSPEGGCKWAMNNHFEGSRELVRVCIEGSGGGGQLPCGRGPLLLAHAIELASFDLEVCRAGNCSRGIVEAPRQVGGRGSELLLSGLTGSAEVPFEARDNQRGSVTLSLRPILPEFARGADHPIEVRVRDVSTKHVICEQAFVPPDECGGLIELPCRLELSSSSVQ